MSFDSGLLQDNVTFELKVEFDPSSQGGRRSLLWNASGAVDLTSKVKRVGPIEHRTEVELHSYVTSDVSLDFTNERTSDGTLHGYFDSSSLATDLGPIENVLCRISMRVLDETAAWSTWSPIYTGLLEDIETSTDDGEAKGNVIGIPNFLVEEPADEVRNVDTWYQNLSINRAIKLLLTQKDRWVPLYGNNESGSVSGATSTTIAISKASGTWGNDLTGQKPNGVLEGYVVVMTSGPAAGKVYTVVSNTGGGGSSATCTVAGNPSGDGVGAGHTCIVTGYCWPYLDTTPVGTTNELSTFTIQPVRKIPTHDGRRVLSIFGRPPEDGSAGITRALAHDGTYLWVGVDSKLYEYDESTDTYTLISYSLTANHKWRRFWYDSGTGYVWGVSWLDPPNNTYQRPYGQAQIHKFKHGTAPSLIRTESDALPGDRLVRFGLRSVSGTKLFIGKSTITGTQFNLVAPFPQELGLAYQTEPDTVKLGFLETPYDLGPLDQSYSPTIPHWYDVSRPWTYATFEVTDAAGIDANWISSSHIGNKYQWVYLNGALFFWACGGSTWTLRKFVLSTATASTIWTIGVDSDGSPAALWEDGTNLYVALNDYGSRTVNTLFRITCYRVTTTGTATLLWQSEPTFPFGSTLFVDACAGDGLSGIGCIMMYVPPGYSAPSPYHQKFLLVKNLHSTSFWSGFKDGSNILAYSVAPWTHFYRNAADDRAWFNHYGGNTLWHGYNATAGRASDLPIVAGERTLASQLCFTPESTWRVLGVSAGDLLDLKPNTGPSQGLYRLWQFAHYHTPRVDLAIFEGLSRWEALRQLAEASIVFISSYTDDGKFQFIERKNSAPTHTLADDGRFAKIGKRLLRKETFNQIVGTPTVGALSPPEVKWLPAALDDDGKPIDGSEFNGTISVRQTDTSTKRVVLVCVVGNRVTYGTRNSPLPVTDTFWKVFNPAASPQWDQSGAATKYPGGWWEPGGHKVSVKFEDNPNESDRVGFQVGDVIEVVCPGIEISSRADERVVAQSGSRIHEFKLRTHSLQNQLVGPSRMKDLCELTLAYFQAPMRQLEAEGRLYPSYKALQSMQISSTRLNVSALVGFIRGVRHDPHGSKLSTVTLREWPTITDPTPLAMPNPVLPAQEPPESGQNGAGELTLVWQYQLPDLCYSSVAIDDIDGDGVQELVLLCWDNTLRVLTPSGVLKWAYNPNTGSGEDHSYGYVCLADVNADGKKDIIWGSHDGYVRCIKHDGSAILWSVANYYTRTATSPPWAAETFFQHGGTWAYRDVSGVNTLCIFVAGFDGRVLCLKASDGSILWQANTNFGNPPWSGSGEHNSDIETQPAIADIDGDGQPELLVCALNYAFRFEHTGPIAYPGTPPDAPTWSFYTDDTVTAIGLADINGDGFHEAIFPGGRWDGALLHRTLFCVDRNGNLLSFFDLDNWSDTIPTIHDIDKDGRKEIIVADDGGVVYCLRWQNGGLAQVWKKQVASSPINASPCLLDVDGDGYREVLVGGGTDGKFTVLDGRNGNVKQIILSPQGGGIEGTITGGDIDGDGLVEVIVPNLQAWRIVVYRGGPTYSNNWFRGYGANDQRTGEVIGV